MHTQIETRVQYIHPEDEESPTVWTWDDVYWGDSPEAFINAVERGGLDDTLIAWIETRTVVGTDWEPVADWETPEIKTKRPLSVYENMSDKELRELPTDEWAGVRARVALMLSLAEG